MDNNPIPTIKQHKNKHHHKTLSSPAHDMLLPLIDLE